MFPLLCSVGWPTIRCHVTDKKSGLKYVSPEPLVRIFDFLDVARWKATGLGFYLETRKLHPEGEDRNSTVFREYGFISVSGELRVTSITETMKGSLPVLQKCLPSRKADIVYVEQPSGMSSDCINKIITEGLPMLEECGYKLERANIGFKDTVDTEWAIKTSHNRVYVLEDELRKALPGMAAEILQSLSVNLERL